VPEEALAIRFDGVTARARGIAPCFDVSLTVPAGKQFVLVGREGAGKTAVRRCLLGDLRPKEGRVLVFGCDPRRERREIARRIRAGELVVLEERFEPSTGATVFATASNPAVAAGADRVGFLSNGRLLLEDDVPALLARFRRIQYVNEITDTRTDYGTELDRFDAVRVKVRGWGVDAVVSNFDDAELERFRRIEGVSEVRTAAMTIEEIFAAVVGEP
jgi:ABC-type multidrug transport system ATPase subunit